MNSRYIDLTDESIHTVEGWKRAGGVIYNRDGVFWAFIPYKCSQRSGKTELEAVTNTITGIVEKRAIRRRQKTIKMAEFQPESASKSPWWTKRLFGGRRLSSKRIVKRW